MDELIDNLTDLELVLVQYTFYEAQNQPNHFFLALLDRHRLFILGVLNQVRKTESVYETVLPVRVEDSILLTNFY